MLKNWCWSPRVRQGRELWLPGRGSPIAASLSWHAGVQVPCCQALYLKNLEIWGFCTEAPSLSNKFMLKQNQTKPKQNEQQYGPSHTYLQARLGPDVAGSLKGRALAAVSPSPERKAGTDPVSWGEAGREGERKTDLCRRASRGSS